MKARHCDWGGGKAHRLCRIIPGAGLAPWPNRDDGQSAWASGHEELVARRRKPGSDGSELDGAARRIAIGVEDQRPARSVVDDAVVGVVGSVALEKSSQRQRPAGQTREHSVLQLDRVGGDTVVE